MKNRYTAALLFLLLSVTEAKRFRRCEVAEIMKKAQLEKYGGVSLADWVCLAYYESKFNSRAVGGPNPDKGRNYGIFQINSRWWCSRRRSKPDFGCKMYCRALVDDDITDDIECVKIIASNSNRMNAWASWKRHCKGKNLSRWTRNCKV
ncbi:lysozyme C-like [Paroedura picta]|uniref:lysozyme C-like n=1 Tax=Paroedura picta TaxID=143630 RepID=UPI0040576D54